MKSVNALTAVDKDAQTIDFLLIVHRGKQVFFKETVCQHGLPNKITIDKSGDKSVAIEGFKGEAGKEI